jgi:hypothetical protein
MCVCYTCYSGLHEIVALHMSYVHTSVESASIDVFNSQRRYNYTTPKYFLDLIALYKSMLGSKKNDIRILKEQLENGLEKMNSAAEQVAELQENLVRDMIIVEAKKAATDDLIVVVGKETAIAEDQKAAAAIEEDKCSAIAEEVIAFQKEYESQLYTKSNQKEVLEFLMRNRRGQSNQRDSFIFTKHNSSSSSSSFAQLYIPTPPPRYCTHPLLPRNCT